MNNEVWKQFAEHEVSHSVAHYLTTIHDLRESLGYARVSDVAKELDVTKGTASVSVKRLKEKGFVAEDANRHLHLTEAGNDVARQVIYTRQVLMRLFADILGVEPSVAESDACKVEHLLSQATCHRLLGLVQLLASDDPCAAGIRSKCREFQIDCGDVENCAICDDHCLLDGEENSG